MRLDVDLGARPSARPRSPFTTPGARNGPRRVQDPHTPIGLAPRDRGDPRPPHGARHDPDADGGDEGRADRGAARGHPGAPSWARTPRRSDGSVSRHDRRLPRSGARRGDTRAARLLREAPPDGRPSSSRARSDARDGWIGRRCHRARESAREADLHLVRVHRGSAGGRREDRGRPSRCADRRRRARP